ncbi:MAG TPA: PIG-L family deacetylase [Candidatus Binatus sp.]|nr:PIG-L family deacetylase [Candidatus Binatus sp.]
MAALPVLPPHGARRRQRRRLWLVVAVLGLASAALALHRIERLPAPIPPPAPAPSRPTTLGLPADARVLIFAAHPDDETVALGGLIYRLVHAGTRVQVVFITNGDGYEQAAEEEFNLRKPTDDDYVALGELRQQEAVAATRRLGLKQHDVKFLGFPDGGLAELWRAHWSRTRPYTSPYTREDNPPYPGAVDPDADYDGMDLTSVIARVLEDFRPTVIIIPHPYDRHPDHVHTTYFVTEAVQHLQGRGVLPQTLKVLTYLVHFPSWPAKRGPFFDRFLPLGTLADTTWEETELTPEELAAKRAALEEYKSQLEVMNGFLRSFLCRNEIFATLNSAVLAAIASVH